MKLASDRKLPIQSSLNTLAASPRQIRQGRFEIGCFIGGYSAFIIIQIVLPGWIVQEAGSRW